MTVQLRPRPTSLTFLDHQSHKDGPPRESLTHHPLLLRFTPPTCPPAKRIRERLRSGHGRVHHMSTHSRPFVLFLFFITDPASESRSQHECLSSFCIDLPHCVSRTHVLESPAEICGANTHGVRVVSESHTGHAVRRGGAGPEHPFASQGGRGIQRLGGMEESLGL